MIELLNVESAKSGKITADEACIGVSEACIGVSEACIGVSQYTLRYRYVTGSGLRPDISKGVALRATPLPRIDLLRRFVTCCFFSVFFVYLSHPG